MARAIDGDALKRWCEKIIDQACHPATVQIGEVFLDKVRSMPTLTLPNETPPCYQPDGDGCAYQCYDGDDEPIDKCKECPLCYSDKQRHLTPPNEPLTLDELREMDEPVWVACKPIEGGNGYWCLCQHGHIITPAGSIYNVKEIPHWVFYRRPPEGEDET